MISFAPSLRIIGDFGHLVSEFVEYYNTARSSMVRDHLPPVRELPEEVETLPLDQIEVKSYVGGLVKSFERKAA